MSTNHTERLTRAVDKALKEAALSEPYGFALSGPSYWPFLDAQGNPIGSGPAWFIVVTIRAGLGEPDIGNGFYVAGILPDDDDFKTTAVQLLQRCRQERDQTNAKAFTSGDEVVKRMKEMQGG